MDVHGLIAKAGGVQALADRLGVARTTVIDWRVSGLIPGSRVAQIALALKISPKVLLPIVRPPTLTTRSRASILQSSE
jgi:DNA-binding transcriptional regulator YdaS (Cro superfamily)